MCNPGLVHKSNNLVRCPFLIGDLRVGVTVCEEPRNLWNGSAQLHSIVSYVLVGLAGGGSYSGEVRPDVHNGALKLSRCHSFNNFRIGEQLAVIS